jgi:hypothetical protein
LFTVSANSETGALLGPGKKGQRVRLQYVSGAWAYGTVLAESPDEPSHPQLKLALWGIADGKAEKIAVVPAGTKSKAFVEVLKQDFQEVRIMMNDIGKGDNSGEVTYKGSIR